MASFSRKLKRKNLVLQRKTFMKDFKRSMANFKKQVKCSRCGRPPNQGENIDEWRINKSSENIDLSCIDCYNESESEKES